MIPVTTGKDVTLQCLDAQMRSGDNQVERQECATMKRSWVHGGCYSNLYGETSTIQFLGCGQISHSIFEQNIKPVLSVVAL
jgi:hypothetical protein